MRTRSHILTVGETETANKRRAFTLIELLVVISIIALLVSILLPSLNKAKDLAKSVVCMSNLNALGIGFNYYFVDNSGMFPPAFGYEDCTNEWMDWWGVYLTEEYEGRGSNYLESSFDDAKSVFKCPESTQYCPDYLSSGYNYAMPSGLSSWKYGNKNRNISQLNQPAITGMLLDSWVYLPVIDWWLPEWHPEASMESDAGNRRTLRHNGGFVDNFLFVDSHVESLKDGKELDYIMYYNRSGIPE